MKNTSNHTKLLLAGVATLALAACSDNDSATAFSCPAIGTIAPVTLGTNQCEISGTLQASATLTSDIQWFLEGRFQVGDTGLPVTLTIEAGTDIFGDNAGSNDYLLVYPGSSLQANGTAASPIRFQSDDANVDGSGEWGGLFLRGFDSIAATGTDGSSLLDYVVVAEAGATTTVAVAETNVSYSDNIVINGVDENTRLTFVQSHNSARDGLHILNSSARMSWILVTGAERDGIWYRDFNGLIKDLLVIHNRDTNGSSGRSGIYASETTAGDSNPRIVNATLVGRDNSSESAASDTAANEFGILFADNTDMARMANILIANFRNGCFEADSGADLSALTADVPNPYIDGIHCANEAGANPNFGIVRSGSTGFPSGTVAANNSNGEGINYYNGAGGQLAAADTTHNAAAGGINFTGEIADRRNNFTSGWYLNNIRGISNGLVASSQALNGFLNGDTNNDGTVESADTNSPFIIADNAFNRDVADDTGGYDMTHVGAVRSGNAALADQFDGWTVATGANGAFTVQPVSNP